jgi:hypothetical protein
LGLIAVLGLKEAAVGTLWKIQHCSLSVNKIDV